MMEKVLYEELRPREFEERLAQMPVAYLPLGTLEWHGLHLPLGADGLMSRSLFIETARRAGGIVLPMLFMAPDITQEKDGETYIGMDFANRAKDEPPRQLPGSAYYVTKEFYVQLLDGVMAQLCRAGFRAVVGHGHGPASEAFCEIIPLMKEKYGLTLLTVQFDQARHGFQTDHAAVNETSILMHTHPELVDMSELDSDPAHVPEGVWGEDPRWSACAEEGRLCIEETVSRLTAALQKEGLCD